MSDENLNVPPAPEAKPAEPPAPAEKPAKDEPGPVPYDRFAEVNEKAKAEAERAAALEQKLKEREEAELTEKERAEKRAEEAEQRAQEAEGKATKLERGGWIKDAAAKAGFQNPADASAFLNLSEIDSEEKAAKAVESLAGERAYLLMGTTERRGLASALSTGTSGDVPLDEDGKPDVKRGLGSDLLGMLSGKG